MNAWLPLPSFFPLSCIVPCFFFLIDIFLCGLVGLFNTSGQVASLLLLLQGLLRISLSISTFLKESMIKCS